MAWVQRLNDWLIRWRILPNDGRPSLTRYLLKHIHVVLIIFLVTLGLEWLGYFRGQESYTLDAWLNLHTNKSPAPIFLVVIDDEDYEALFRGTSPLNAEVLEEALEAIELGGPAVIGVDLDTSSPQFAGREYPEAVWVRSASVVDEGNPDTLSVLHSAGALEEIRRGRFLGGDGRELKPNHDGVIETEPRSGPSLFLGEEDGLVRRYRHLYHSPESVPPSDVKGYVESFPWAIARAYAEWLRKNGQADSPVARRIEREEHHGAEGHGHHEEIVLTFGASRDRFSKINLRSLLKASKQPYWKNDSPLKDSIVLLGGTYAAGRDHYVTPAGPRYGVELVAHAVETSLAHGGIRPLHHWQAYLIDLLVGVMLLVIFWRFPGNRAFVGTLIAAGLLAYVASFLAFRSFAYWLNFAPMVGGLWLHYQWEKRQEQREFVHELHALREEVARLKGAAPHSTPKSEQAAH